MNIKYRIILWNPQTPNQDYIRSKVMTADKHGREGVYNRIRTLVSAGSNTRGPHNDTVFAFFHIEEENGTEHWIGYNLIQNYVISVEWL